MALLPLPILFSHDRSYCLDSISKQDSNLIELVKCYLHTLPADEVISRIVSITDRVIVEAEFDRRQNEILNRIQHRLSLYTDDELYRRNGLEYRQSRRTRSAERRISGLWRSYRYRPEVADFRTNWLAAKELMQGPSADIEAIEKEFEIWQTEILIIENIANAEDWELLDGDQDGQAFTNFTNFLDLPTDLRLKIWNHAFPPQTVNVIYDPGQHRFLLLGSPPVLPQIHSETREFYLQTHTLSLGTKTHAASMNFDPVGDILMYSWFPNDDIKTDWPSGEPLGPSIRNVAIPASSLQYTKLEGSPDPELDGLIAVTKSTALEAAIMGLLERFPSLKTLYITINESANPYSRGRIRFFPLQLSSIELENDPNHIEFYSIFKEWRDAFDLLKTSMTPQMKGIDVQMVGAWQGGSREGYGCMLDGLEDEDDDEFYDPNQDRYDSENGDSDRFYDSSEDESDSDGGEIVTEEVETRIDANHSLDYDENGREFVSNDEVDDLKNDESAYESSVGDGEYSGRQGRVLSSDYYNIRTKLPGRCYHIFHADGSYRAT
ncbi:hypothetical protein V501_01005 [Pseudogymnoascus sp. VKM F-4519 (FW-2642)]|nr:hypothetical protein V501_01005 [Pseudogymnoascus sp. VKM F-4519 (FW-2642)]